LVEERLHTWDILPPESQKAFLNSEMIRSFFSRFDSEAARAEWRRTISQMSAERRAELEQGLDRWRGLSEEERQKTLSRFNHVFELTLEERQKVLDTLPDDERRQMETTLTAYTNLSPTQRAQCIRSFEKFTG